MIDNSLFNTVEEKARIRKEEILNSADELKISGQAYYVSADGNDELDGKTPETAWKTLARASKDAFNAGDGVFFRRGDVFRGQLRARNNVSYGAYGKGEKPKLYAWDHDLADETMWELYDAEANIWKYTGKILDVGTLVFNHGEKHSRKLIPTYTKDGEFVCRDDLNKKFVMKDEMTEDLDIFCYFTDVMTETPTKGESFPIPVIDEKSFGDLYLRCDGGNPGHVFTSIEALAKRHNIFVGGSQNVRIDNLCIKYGGAHGIAAGALDVVGLCVTNCEIGWIGGSIQHYYGTDPNYPEGKRGSVTRYGNGVEIYGGCTDYKVVGCYIYQNYDAGVTHQVTARNTYIMQDVLYADNLIEYCTYAIEYFLEKEPDNDSIMENVEIRGNILRLSGYGFGHQRHNKETPALIKGWSYENTAENFKICDNIFDRSRFRMLHLVAKEASSCPEMDRNTYLQYKGGWLGQYGANREKEPEIIIFEDNAGKIVEDLFGDANAMVGSAPKPQN